MKGVSTPEYVRQCETIRNAVGRRFLIEVNAALRSEAEPVGKAAHQLDGEGDWYSLAQDIFGKVKLPSHDSPAATARAWGLR
jgi:hypothetical protein